MSDAAPPTMFAALREFAYPTDATLPWSDRTPPDQAEEFHEASKVHAAFPGQALGPAGKQLASLAVDPFALGRKSLAFTGQSIALPRTSNLDTDLVELAARRRTMLPDNAQPVAMRDLGAILELCGSSSPARPTRRVVPSAGAMYPVDIIVIANRVTNLASGAYVYDPIRHALLARGEVVPETFHRDASGPNSPPALPSVTLALVATFARTRAKYGLRGYRFALLEAGHIAQAAITTATGLGLATLPWGGFIDNSVNRQLDLDGTDRACLYLLGLSAGADT